MQKRATKLIISLKTLPYQERLRRLKLPTLKYSRRLRGYMIEVFKINNIYSTVSVPVLPFAPTSSVTRGNFLKLLNQRFYHDIRKYSFIPRIINTLNSLPDFVVNVDSVNVFENRLNTFWSEQEILFDYTAEITRIGNRSKFIS